jgi:hypothetical protein
VTGLVRGRERNARGRSRACGGARSHRRGRTTAGTSDSRCRPAIHAGDRGVGLRGAAQVGGEVAAGRAQHL